MRRILRVEDFDVDRGFRLIHRTLFLGRGSPVRTRALHSLLIIVASQFASSAASLIRRSVRSRRQGWGVPAVVVAYLSVSVLTVLQAESASSTTVVYRFDGSVEFDGFDGSSVFQVGDSFSATVEYDTTAMDWNGDPGIGQFRTAIESIEFRIGSYLGGSGGDAWITVQDDVSLRLDVLSIIDGGSVGPALTNGPPVSGDGDLGPGTFLPWGLEITFQDTDGTALASDSLPAAIPGLSEFEQTKLRLTFDDFATSVGGSISSITLVPEPSVSVLFGLGLVTLASESRRRAARSA